MEETGNIKIEKKQIWKYLFFVVLLVVILFVFTRSKASDNSPVGSDEIVSSAQKISLGIKSYNYYPNTIRVKVNEPVEISLDSSVKGCYRSFTIPELNIKKYLATPSDKLVFTPTEKGTYRFACSMGMGYGTIIVE